MILIYDSGIIKHHTFCGNNKTSSLPQKVWCLELSSMVNPVLIGSSLSFKYNVTYIDFYNNKVDKITKRVKYTTQNKEQNKDSLKTMNQLKYMFIVER